MAAHPEAVVEKSNQITWSGNIHAIFAPVYSTPQRLIMTFCCTNQTLRRFSVSDHQKSE
jgi:hypothetical protein